MKQLTCEMCGSTEMVKQDGFFVCQTCGTKYSVEEAKRMMIEGTVDVQGTVKVDNSNFVEKYLANARRAKQKEDWDETEKYYNMVEQNDPTNIEAIFYSAYGKAKKTLVDSDLHKRQAVFKVLQNSVSVIDDNFSVDKAEDKNIINQIVKDVVAMSRSSYVYNTKTNQFGVQTWSDKKETEKLFIDLIDELIKSLWEIVKKVSNADKIEYYNHIIYLHKHQRDYMGLTKEAQSLKNNQILAVHELIVRIAPSHKKDLDSFKQVLIIEEAQEERRKKNIKIGCFSAIIAIIVVLLLIKQSL